MNVMCPRCGHIIEIRHLGRTPLNLPVTIVCDALQRANNARATARELHCSPAYVYKELHSNHLSIDDALGAEARTGDRVSLANGKPLSPK